MENKINPTNRPLNPPARGQIAQVPPPARRQTRRSQTAQQPASPKVSRKPTTKKKPTRQLPWKKLLANFVALTVLWGGAALMGGGAWIAYQLIVDPNEGIWMNQFLPRWSRLPIASGKSIQTLLQVQASLQKVGLKAGEPLLLLPKSGAATLPLPEKSEVLVPVLSPHRPVSSVVCKNPCYQVTELRVYQPVQIPGQTAEMEQYYRLVTTLTVEGPAESYVWETLAEFNRNDPSELASNQPLPITSVQRFAGKVPASGIWLNLSGELRRGDKKIPYGQVIHYNPSHSHLISLLEWVSATGQSPSWQDAIQGGEPELAVDQTLGLDPQFRIYQVQPRQFVPNPVQLTAVSLDDPAIDDGAYRNALRLARGGLWSPAFAAMRAFKTKAQRNWTAQAQAQLDLIAFHAKVTQTQAGGAWASPGQQVLADLIDGRWEPALKVFEGDLANSYEVGMLLKNDEGRLWNRVDAALQVNPYQPEVLAWGALIIASQDGFRAAWNWLDGQLGTDGAVRNRVGNLLGRLDEAMSQSWENHTSQIVGSASVLNYVDPVEWQQPVAGNGLNLGLQEVWYQVQVTSFFDGRRWVRTPFLEIDLSSFPATQVKYLWKRLGLQTDPKIKIEIPQSNGRQRVAVGTVKAVPLKDGILRLLAAVDRGPER